ncbi:MAG: bifunctional hydroxymethylpyrimidine kinase/phosphomethylpyrimidine kinase [Gracilimonas sp.]|uniref:bifunctional hydroxymethylpyrimidine kinase/phosphomethylpyrimidine kinase n=1 Tax=Gracilimonas sp. TaxID=1974203 RepID=UPI0037517686|nr:bifunctional hydroxymethylpyrimidine kinase/phosphomethylpyrimidine kinase [Gracilimonas sp.]
MNHSQIPTALTIAGSDPSGGAGVQADLKVFNALNVYGTAALTCLTAGNTTGVQAVEFIKPHFVKHQIECVLEDIPPRAVKTGMLGNSGIMRVTAAKLASLNIPVIIDPVMKTKRGDVLFADEGIKVFIEEILPLAHIITPNIPEANLLSGISIKRESDMKAAARKIYEMGSGVVLIKAGYFDDWPHSNDLYFDGKKFTWIKAERIQTTESHGAGDVFSAAITAYTARKLPLLEAVQQAKKLVSKALLSAPGLGKGDGPLNLM